MAKKETTARNQQVESSSDSLDDGELEGGGKVLPFELEWGARRPKTVAECVGRPLPCPWVGCRYHMLIDVEEGTGTIKVSSGSASRRSDGRPGSPRGKVHGWAVRTAKSENEARSDQIVDRLMDMGEDSCLLHMLRKGQSRTLEEVGSVMKVTRERVRQIEANGLVKLRVQRAKGELDVSPASMPMIDLLGSKKSR